MRRPIEPISSVLVVALLAVVGCGSQSASTDSPPAAPTGISRTPAAEQAADPAPALAGIAGWHNSEPLTLDALRGSPVLLVFFRDT